MAKSLLLYDPPLITGDLAEHRAEAFAGTDRELIEHVGYFISWFAATEFMLTVLMHTFSGRISPTQFHVLTKGMDARLKIERLKNLVDGAGWAVDPPFLHRLDHFLQKNGHNPK